jgi:hypothetical protein
MAWPELPGVQYTTEIFSPRKTQWCTFTPFPLAMIATWRAVGRTAQRIRPPVPSASGLLPSTSVRTQGASLARTLELDDRRQGSVKRRLFTLPRRVSSKPLEGLRDRTVLRETPARMTKETH